MINIEESKIKIGFTFTDRFGNEYSATSEVEMFDSLGYSEVDAIGDKLNVFLRQLGYPRNNDNILMEDLTDEEHEALLDYLYEIRENDNGEQDI